jgi:hypothetical protein
MGSERLAVSSTEQAPDGLPKERVLFPASLAALSKGRGQGQGSGLLNCDRRRRRDGGCPAPHVSSTPAHSGTSPAGQRAPGHLSQSVASRLYSPLCVTRAAVRVQLFPCVTTPGTPPGPAGSREARHRSRRGRRGPTPGRSPGERCGGPARGAATIPTWKYTPRVGQTWAAGESPRQRGNE